MEVLQCKKWAAFSFFLSLVVFAFIVNGMKYKPDNSSAYEDSNESEVKTEQIELINPTSTKDQRTQLLDCLDQHSYKCSLESLQSSETASDAAGLGEEYASNFFNSVKTIFIEVLGYLSIFGSSWPIKVIMFLLYIQLSILVYVYFIKTLSVSGTSKCLVGKELVVVNLVMDVAPMLGILGTIYSFAYVATNGEGQRLMSLFKSGFLDAALTTIIGGLIYIFARYISSKYE